MLILIVSNSLLQRMRWQDPVRLAPGYFTDTGYRFRLNNFEHTDNWYWPFKNEVSFTDMTLFNHNEL